MLERAPAQMRGGNTRHTRNVRCVHAADEFNRALLLEELWTTSAASARARATSTWRASRSSDSASVPGWMAAHGARWQPPLAGTLQLGRTNRFFLGGGKALLNSYYRQPPPGRRRRRLRRRVEALRVRGPALRRPGRGARRRPPGRVAARSVVCAAGASRRTSSGCAATGATRSTTTSSAARRTTTARAASLYDARRGQAGEEKGLHAVARRRAGAQVRRRHRHPARHDPLRHRRQPHGQRFYDEGEDLWPKRYAIWGRNIAEPARPDRVLDLGREGDRRVPAAHVPRDAGGRIGDLAAALGLDRDAFTRTVGEYNAAVVPGGSFDPTVLDDCRTEGLTRRSRTGRSASTRRPTTGIAMRPGHHLHLHGRRRSTDARVRREGRLGLRKRLRGGGDHVGQHLEHRVPRRVRPDDRQPCGDARAGGGGGACQSRTLPPRPRRRAGPA